MVINNTKRGHRVISKPVIEKQDLKNLTDSLKETEVVRKAEPFISSPDTELPPDPIIKEPEAKMSKLEVEELKISVEKNQVKKQQKKKKNPLEEILKEEDKENKDE